MGFVLELVFESVTEFVLVFESVTKFVLVFESVTEYLSESVKVL